MKFAEASARFEIYAQAFPTSRSKWQISTNGGGMVRWGHERKELFYVDLDGWLIILNWHPERGK